MITLRSPESVTVTIPIGDCLTVTASADASALVIEPVFLSPYGVVSGATTVFSPYAQTLIVIVSCSVGAVSWGMDRSQTPNYITNSEAKAYSDSLLSSVFGTGVNKSTFEADGTLLAEGAASTFDDISGAATGLQQTGSGVALNTAENTVDFLTSANLSDYMYTSIQMSHRCKIGAPISPHVHFTQTTAAVPNLLVQYRWQRMFAAKATAWINLAANVLLGTYPGSGSFNQIAECADVTPPVGAMISDIIEFRIFRDNTNSSGAFAGADPVAATVQVKSFDVHIETDTLGSRSEYVK